MNRIYELPIQEADARLFLTVAEVDSFANAAVIHSITPSAVSKAIARLEAGLGVRLFTRTTRKLHLTEEGNIFAERCSHAFRLLADAAEEASANSRSVSGVLRLGVPPLLGTFLIAPLLPKLLARHPKLRIDLVTLVRLSDFTRSGADCAIVIGELQNSSLVARQLGHGLFVTVASPAYLRAAGTPTDVSDLERHRKISFIGPDGRESPWWFSGSDGRFQYDPHAQVRSDEMHHLCACASAGLGITQAPLYVVSRQISSGRLVRVLTDQESPPKLASIIYPAGITTPRRVKAFVDFVLGLEKEGPGLYRPKPFQPSVRRKGRL